MVPRKEADLFAGVGAGSPTPGSPATRLGAESLNMIQAAIGLKAKTGRAIAVVLSDPTDAPQLIKRTELILTDPRVPATFQPYHEVMDLPWSESEKRVVPFIRAIEKIAAKALAELVHELRSQDVRVVGVGIAGAADRDLSKIGGYHIRAHAAEGLLFRQVLEFAAKANKLPHCVFIEKKLQPEAISKLRCTIVKLNNSLKTLGRSAGPPWRTEQRVAATAAWLALMNERKSSSSTREV